MKSPRASRAGCKVNFISRRVVDQGRELRGSLFSLSGRVKAGGPILLIVWLAGLLAGGCAFDVSYVKKVPVKFTSDKDLAAAPEFLLKDSVRVRLGTGFPTYLQNGTRWRLTGRTEVGSVYSTKDQIVTVEASNIYEAMLVVSNRNITGFYLPVEKLLVPVSPPIPIRTEP